MTAGRVLLLHSIALDGRAYEALRQALGAGWELQADDLRGHGMRAGETRFTLAGLVQDAVDAIERSEGPVHLVGHSFGGAIAALAAARAGSKVASLALLATPAAGVPAFDERAAAAEQDIAATHAATLQRWLHGETAATDAMVATAQRAMAALQPAGLAAAWRALASFEGYAGIERLPRTLCIAGAADASTPPQVMERIVATRREVQPGADIVLHSIPGAGHMVPLTHPRAVAALLAAHWTPSRNHQETSS